MLGSKVSSLNSSLNADLHFTSPSVIPSLTPKFTEPEIYDPLGLTPSYSQMHQMSRLNEEIDTIRAKKNLRSDHYEGPLTSSGLMRKIDQLGTDLGISFRSYGGGWDV